MTISKTSINTAELIAGALRADILQGRLKSSQPLRQDDIAAKFGVSKIPVREALYQLKAEGLVTFIPNRGAAVSELSIQEVDEIYAMRIALETVALQRALPRLTIADLTRADDILIAIDHEQNVARWSELNWEFHATLYAPANLPRLLDWVHTLHVNVARYLVIYLASLDYQTTSQQEHRTIVTACRHGDIETATKTLQLHLQSASQQLTTFLTQRQIK